MNLRIGLIGCGRAARIHAERLRGISGVQIVGCADVDLPAAQAMAADLPDAPPAFGDFRDLLTQAAPEAVAIFTPHRTHYRLAMDALQAGCHVFIEKPLSTNLQEAHDIVNLARGRGHKVGVGHQFRLSPSLVEVRARLASGAIGRLRLVTAVLTQPWLDAHSGPGESWRLDPRVSGGGILADSGVQLIDALLWTTGRTSVEAAAFQDRVQPGLDLVTAATVRLSEQVVATLGISGVAPAARFELLFHGENGWLRATDQALRESLDGKPEQAVDLPPQTESIDSNFVAAVTTGRALCCPAEAAVDSVRLLEALGRSASTGQVVRIS